MGNVIRFPRYATETAGAPGRPFFFRLAATSELGWKTMPQFLRAVMKMSETFGATVDGAQSQAARAAGAFVVGDEGVFLGVAMDGERMTGHVYAYFEILDGYRTATVYQIAADHVPVSVWRDAVTAFGQWADKGEVERVTFYASNYDGRGLARARRLRHVFGKNRPATIRSHWCEVKWPKVEGK